MQRKGTKLLLSLTLLVLLFCFWAWQDAKEIRDHKEMLAAFQKMDTYGSFPLISVVVEGQTVFDYDLYIHEGELTCSLFYESIEVEKELVAYRKYLLQHGYNDVTPAEKPEGVLAVYQEDGTEKRITTLQTDHGYELQFWGL